MLKIRPFQQARSSGFSLQTPLFLNRALSRLVGRYVNYCLGGSKIDGMRDKWRLPYLSSLFDDKKFRKTRFYTRPRINYHLLEDNLLMTVKMADSG